MSLDPTAQQDKCSFCRTIMTKGAFGSYSKDNIRKSQSKSKNSYVSYVLGSMAQNSCTVSESERIECGFVGITEDGCTARGCCWRRSDTNNVPWCFQQNSEWIIPIGKYPSMFLRDTQLLIIMFTSVSWYFSWLQKFHVILSQHIKSENFISI